ncbi:SIR2 family NAD-dependent protein deacylase [Haladaptatus sp. NG-SE-30]
MEEVARLADELSEAETVVALTGAGMSTASGVPDFRSESGVWNRFDPEDFHYRRFRSDPAGFWADRLELHEAMFGDDIAPNAAHDALTELAADGHLHTILTQNTDGLHEGAILDRGAHDESIDDGAMHDETAYDATTQTELIELHGNARRVVCDDCSHRTDAAPVRARVESGECPPHCDECGGIYKPDVVLFGERLDEFALQRARECARRADVFLAIGSSLSVEPAASLPRTAVRTGATTAIINLDETPVSQLTDFDIRGDVTEVLPELVERVADDS